MDGRQFLVEEVPVAAISEGMAALPLTTLSSITNSHIAFRPFTLPPQRLARASTKPMFLAKKSVPPLGFVLDYQIVNSNLTNITFQGDSTYYISGAANLFGTTTFEGGAVLKYPPNFSTVGIFIWDTPPVFKTAAYRPAIFTSINDNSVGEVVFPTNFPVVGVATYLTITLNDSGNDVTSFPYLRFAYAGTALQYNFSANPRPVQDCQFVNCGTALEILQGSQINPTLPLSVNNVLFSQCGTALISDGNLMGANITADQVDTFYDCGDSTSMWFTNCIFTAVTDITTSTVLFDHCIQAGSGSGVYQTVGAGSYYLAISSTNRNAGTINIDPAMWAELQKKTTYPPILYANITVSTNMALSPQAQRDTDTPDLGFHYDPIDYLAVNFWITNATLTVTNGAVIAGYNDQDIMITDGSSIVSIGTPLLPNWFTRYSSAQEQSVALGAAGGIPANTDMINPYHATNAPSGQFQFTKFSCPAGGGYHLYHGQFNWAYSNLSVRDCEFWSGNNDFRGYNSATAVLNDNLFARSTMSAAGSPYTNSSLVLSNNLFWNTPVIIRAGPNSNVWSCFNNAFDNVIIQTNSTVQLIGNGYNAYLGSTTNRLYPTNAHDVVSTNAFVFQSGPLGDFYQPTNSILINTGSVTADLTGLYHYTTTTNQVKETNSIVDIGYHYVALDGTNNPLDSNGDRLPDYQQDANGNGIFDSGDLSDWLSTDTDGDGVPNIIEVMEGRNPLVPGAVPDTGGGVAFDVYTPFN
jgi:hypothetical protein